LSRKFYKVKNGCSDTELTQKIILPAFITPAKEAISNKIKNKQTVQKKRNLLYIEPITTFKGDRGTL
jgi:hypothetical protein